MKKFWHMAGLVVALVWSVPATGQEAAHEAQTPTVASPLMWVMRDADSTVYIFGTIHLMKTGAQWQTPVVMDAFVASDELWLEINDIDDATKMQGLIVKYGIDPSQNVTDGLTSEEIAQLDAALKPLGISSAHVAPMKKWLVGLMLVQAEAMRLGYDPANGVDMVLLKSARERGLPVKAFETSEQQVLILAGGTPEEDLLTLRQTLADLAAGEDTLDRLFYAWLSGDEGAIDREMNVYTKDAPDMYKRLIVDRNAAWVPQIEQIMDGEGTVFIAVGAGHLVGADSVIAMLRAKGYVLTQVQP